MQLRGEGKTHSKWCVPPLSQQLEIRLCGTVSLCVHLVGLVWESNGTDQDAQWIRGCTFNALAKCKLLLSCSLFYHQSNHAARQTVPESPRDHCRRLREPPFFRQSIFPFICLLGLGIQVVSFIVRAL